MITLRNGRASDAHRVVDIRNKAFATPLADWLDSYAPINVIEAEVLQYASIAKGTRHWFMACDEHGKVVGYIAFVKKGRGTEVAPSWLGQVEGMLFSLQVYLLNIVLYWSSRAQLQQRKARMKKFVAEIDADLEETVKTLQLDQFVYVESLAVDPDAHGGGIGSKLLQKAVDEAQNQSIPLLLESNSRAVDFYLKKDFKLVGKPFEFWVDGQHLGTWPNMILDKSADSDDH